MADPRRPGLQLFEQLFPQEATVQNAGLEKLRGYLENQGSIFPLVERGVQGLVRELQVSPEDAQRFLRRANSMATYLRRQFIEQQLRGDAQEEADTLSWASLVGGPSFEMLFPTGFEKMCPPDALESCASPVAYLVDLLLRIQDKIEPLADKEKLLPLHERRADLKALEVDFNAVYRSVSAVEIIVRVLEAFIKKQSPEDQPALQIEDALIQARYPNGLPYYEHWVTIDSVTRSKGLSVGNFASAVDLSYPWFLHSVLWGARAERGLAHASRLGPYQRSLLTEPGAELEEFEAFYLDNFGAEGVAYANLNQVTYFADHTKLDTPGIERLLSVRDFAPVRSANVRFADEAPKDAESGRSGSVYINANAKLAIHITEAEGGSSSLHRLSVDPSKQEGLDALDRMNRMIRLCNWLELPSDQVDALLVAAIRAEVRGGGADEDAWWISDEVIHALGLFQTLREDYNCTAADFAVFVDQLSVYGRGEALSQFDQVFNNQGEYRQPLVLDEGSFPVIPVPGEVNLTINQLCNGLGIDLQTYQELALTVARAYDITDNSLKRSLPIISSFYRLVRLPRLLNITPVEGLLMLSRLGDEGWVRGLAGEPQINVKIGTQPDVLNIIAAMQACVQWCSQIDLPVLWVLQHAAPSQPAREASEQDRQLFDQIRNLLPTAKFSNVSVLMAGLPPAGTASWLDFLTTEIDRVKLIDADGLVLAAVGTPEQYLLAARKRLEWAIDNALGVVEKELRTTLTDILLKVLLQARDAQVSLVKETLSVYAGIEVDQAIPVLNWAHSTVYDFLQHVNARVESDTEQSPGSGDANPEALLALLTELRRRSEVVSTLGLSAALLQDYLDYGFSAWSGQPDPYDFSIRTLYHLTTLTRAFDLSTQPAQKLLDYLRQVNALPDSLGVDAKRLAQQAAAIRLAEFFGWSVQEVRECVSRLDPTLQILKNLTQLALLLRVRVLSSETGMDTLTIFLIGDLPEAVDKVAYTDAARLALLSAEDSRAPLIPTPGNLSQLVTTTSSVEPTEIVAGSGTTATYTVTLKDADGQPLSGVMVHFRANLGHIEGGFTQPDGTVKATYTPGKEQGTDTPVYWLDLFEPESARAINLIADAGTLEFSALLKSPVPSGTVARGEEVELYATLIDQFGNLGTDKLVDWSAVPVPPQKLSVATVRPSNGFTNKEGLTRVFVSSATGGTFSVSVISQGSELLTYFDDITFEGDGTPP